MMRLRGDIVSALIAACDHRLAGIELAWDARASLGVVMASGGYPESYAKGHEIRGLDNLGSDTDVKVFHAGTRLADDDRRVVTSGGRVLCVTALGENVTQAKAQAYEIVKNND